MTPEDKLKQSASTMYIQWLSLFPLGFIEAALNCALIEKDNFVPTTVTNNRHAERNSSYLDSFPTISECFLGMIRMHLPEALDRLKLPWFAVQEIECQMTVHGDGCFYNLHNDNGDTGVANRVISYAYYFHKEPKAFTGGELSFGSQLVQPLRNSIVMFPSSLWHQVLPVSCPSGKFEDSRFTINGWIRSK